MRQAMANAEVGDDVFGDDPTVNALQDYAADLLGKEAALFCSSGTQGNVIAALTHCGRGDELIVGKAGHIFQWEGGAASVLGGISMSQIPVQPDGTIRLEDIRAQFRDPNNPHHPLTRLICIENTQGGVGGVPITPEYTAQVGELAHTHGYRLHIDGARLFNAAAALKVHPRELAAPADTVQICLSKGLCAPVGSLIVGSKDFIRRAVRTRKILGGGMRQAGMIAAAGLIALRDMRERLADDHATAQMLADGLATIPGISVHPIHHRTNMVFITLPDSVNPADFVEKMKQQGIILLGGKTMRLVTHYWITAERVQTVIDAFRAYIAENAHTSVAAGEQTASYGVVTQN
jgi:threonine aldolase